MIIYCQNVWNCNPTAFRNRLIADRINALQADICLFQEFGPGTTQTGPAPLQDLLADRYTRITPDSGNYTPLFYRTEGFALLDSGYLRFDGRNDAGSKSVSWAVLEEKGSGFRFGAASTHFWWKFDDPEDNAQRLANADQLKAVCDRMAENWAVPVIVGGDFNNGTNAAQGDEPYRYLLSLGFTDMRTAAPVTTDAFTHHGYPVLQPDDSYTPGPLPRVNLDYLFTYGPHPAALREFAVHTDPQALTTSDHCPLVGKIERE